MVGIWFSLFPGVIGILTMIVADGAGDLSMSLLGLGMLLLGLTMVVLHKLDQIRSAIHGSGDNIETVLKQRLH